MSEKDHGCASKGITGSFKSLERMLIYHENHLKASTSCLWGKPLPGLSHTVPDHIPTASSIQSPLTAPRHRACFSGKPDVEDRSGCRYNEVVLDGDKYASQLPHVIEAFFFPEHGPVHHHEGDEGQARTVRHDFARAYGLGRDETPPLLAFDVMKARAGEPPFREASA